MSKFFDKDMASKVPSYIVSAEVNENNKTIGVLKKAGDNFKSIITSPEVEKALQQIRLLDEVIKNNPGVQITEETDKEINRILSM